MNAVAKLTRDILISLTNVNNLFLKKFQSIANMFHGLIALSNRILQSKRGDAMEMFKWRVLYLYHTTLPGVANW